MLCRLTWQLCQKHPMRVFYTVFFSTLVALCSGLYPLAFVVLGLPVAILVLDAAVFGIGWVVIRLCNTAYQGGKSALKRPATHIPQASRPDPALLRQQQKQAALTAAASRRDLKLSMASTLPEYERESWIAAAEREYRLKLIELMEQV